MTDAMENRGSGVSRRSVLRVGGQVGAGIVGVGLLANGAKAESPRRVGEDPVFPALKLHKFVDRLRIPPVYRPRRRGGSAAELTMRMRPAKLRFHSEMQPSSMWTYEGHFPGPTIEVRRDQRVRIDWVNEIDTPMPLIAVEIPDEVPGRPPGIPADSYPGRDGKDPLPSVTDAPAFLAVHLHGGHTSGGNDGWMENGLLRGMTQHSEYLNDQPATALWYHDHGMFMTRFTIMSGLHGLYVIRDEEEDSLDLPSGRYEVPLIFSDRNFDADPDGYPNGLVMHKMSIARTDPARIITPFKGPYHSVNGVIWPYFDVEPTVYRFRMHNASNARVYRFCLVDEDNNVLSRDAMSVIGTDGGLIHEPIPVEEGLQLSVAERADVLVDFSQFAGRTLRFVTARPEVEPGEQDLDNNVPEPDIIQFRVGRRRVRSVAPAPKRLARSFESLRTGATPTATTHRLVVLTSPSPTFGDPQMWEMEEVDVDEVKVPSEGVVQIVGQDEKLRTYRKIASTYEETTNFVIAQGSWEEWTFINVGGPPHPMHIHLVRFQPTRRDFYDITGWDPLLNGTRKPLTYMRPSELEPHELGWKDVVRIAAGIETPGRGEMVSVMGQFGSGNVTGRYVYHCHLLEHEHGMMRPFVVLPAKVMALNSHGGHGDHVDHVDHADHHGH